MTRRLSPEGDGPESTSNCPWVIVLSDWSQRSQELVQRVQGLFRQTGANEPVPTVLVVDDLGSATADHRMLLKELTEAGVIVLAPEPEEEIATIRRAPLAFAATQLASMQASPAVATAFTPSGPSEPDGYKELAKAVTRLSPEALQEVIEGRRWDDGRSPS